MKKIIKFSMLFVFIFFINIVVKADTSCQSEELKRLKDLANNVEITYKENITEEKVGDNVFKDVNYSITVTNLNNNIKVMIIDDLMKDNYKEFKSNTNIATLNGFRSGEKVTLTIMAFVPNGCSGKTLLTRSINLPYYNIFSEGDECKAYPDFKYCTTWIENTISRDTFDSEFTKYTDSIKKNAETPNTEKGSNSLLSIILIIIVVLIALGIVFYVVYQKHQKKGISYKKIKGVKKYEKH